MSQITQTYFERTKARMENATSVTMNLLDPIYSGSLQFLTFHGMSFDTLRIVCSNFSGQSKPTRVVFEKADVPLSESEVQELYEIGKELYHQFMIKTEAERKVNIARSLERL